MRDVGEELAEARAERVHAVHGRQEGAEERVPVRGAEPVVEVDLGNWKQEVTVIISVLGATTHAALHR